jgi:hypothetical protein
VTRVVWGESTDRKYEYGVDRGVLYPIGQDGVPWNGLISVEETIVGGEQTPYYFDGVKYLDVIANEDYQASLTAISAPDEFASCEGSRLLAAGLFATQQRRTLFNLCYRTRIGDMNNPSLGYKLHLVWNCTASPSGRTYSTKSDKIEPGSRTWTIDAVPPPNPASSDYPTVGHPVVNYKPVAHMVVDSTLAGLNFSGYEDIDPVPKITLLEHILYGTDTHTYLGSTVPGTAPRMPTQAEVIDILDNYGI